MGSESGECQVGDGARPNQQATDGLLGAHTPQGRFLAAWACHSATELISPAAQACPLSDAAAGLPRSSSPPQLQGIPRHCTPSCKSG